MNRILRLTALLLVLAILTGCTQGSLRQRTEERKQSIAESTGEHIFSTTLSYTRPDLEELTRLRQEAAEAARSGSLGQTMDAIYDFYDAYDWFYTFYALADIRYCADLTDAYWEEEYRFCMEAAPQVDTAMEELYYDLAQSPLREKLEADGLFGPGFFDDYLEENTWDGEFLALLEEESALINRYYTLSEEGLAYSPGSRAYYNRCADDMARLLVDLIRVRNAMAASWGYDSYDAFAWDYYYYRDFTPKQALDYYGQIASELTPLYRQTSSGEHWDAAYLPSDSEATYDYVRRTAQNMGGTVWEAFQLMEERELYDIRISENKYAASFVYYLTSYGVPFVFLDPAGEQYDHLSFVHEFGHFCSDYAAGGSAAGIDVGEVFSQGMEYMSLSYGSAGEGLTRAKLADALATYVEQAAYGSFEQRMYRLEGEELSVEGLYRLYEQVAEEFAFDAIGYDRREFVDVTHFYTNPMYIVSYVLSNDAALQLYLLEREEPGAGAELLMENLATEQAYFLAFLEEAGLESPFRPGGLSQMAEFFKAELT